MPKSRKKGQQERKNRGWRGFVAGLFIGMLTYGIGLGFWNLSSNLMILARLAIFVGLVFGLFLTVYNAYAKKAFFSPLTDGLISGFVFGTTILDVYLHGLGLF